MNPPDVAPMDNCMAFQSIEQYLLDELITPDAAQEMKRQYLKLHELMSVTSRRERELMTRAKNLNTELLTEKIALEKQSIRESEGQSSTLQLEREKDKIAKDLRDCHDRDSSLTYEVSTCQSQHIELLEQKEALVAEKSGVLEPEVQAHVLEIAQLSQERAHVGAQLVAKSATQSHIQIRMADLVSAKAKLEEQVVTSSRALKKIRLDPERVAKKAQMIEKTQHKIEAENATTQAKVKAVDETLGYHAQKMTQLDEQLEEVSGELDHHREALEEHQNQVEHARQLLEEEQGFYHQLLTEQLALEMKSKQAQRRSREENESLNTLTKEFDRLKRQLKKKQMLVDQEKSLLPNLKAQVNDVRHSIVLLQTKVKNKIQAEKMSKQQVELAIAKFMKSEKIEQVKKDELESLMSDVREKEAELSQWMAEETKQNRIILALTAQREIKSREATSAKENEKAKLEELKMKELILMDLAKSCHDTNNRLREFSALYDVVKNERNKYVNLIQSCTQASAEMKEKIKILHNEEEVLRNESNAKDSALVREKAAHQAAQSQRDAFRLDSNKAQAIYWTKQEHVEQQIVEIDKLNSIINALEKDMLKLKKSYERGIDGRNFAGVQLIDRNDELCILYEKCNLQEQTLEKGQIALTAQDQKLRMLRLDIQEHQRCIEVTRKHLPKIPQHAAKIMHLTKELSEKQKETELLCADLEQPKNQDRWRALPGEDPDMEQLQVKVTVLEEQLSMKKEQLLEKDLILEEVTTLANQLRTRATEGRDDTIQLSKKINSCQSSIKDVTRKMMATVSELSMYQATNLKLQREKEDLHEHFVESMQRYEEGEIPNPEAEKAWYAFERENIRKEELVAKQRRTSSSSSRLSVMNPTTYVMTKTTADPRPNAYIPSDELGIPKPYGQLAPFKPTISGATMRHIRKPEPKDIEI